MNLFTTQTPVNLQAMFQSVFSKDAPAEKPTSFFEEYGMTVRDMDDCLDAMQDSLITAPKTFDKNLSKTVATDCYFAHSMGYRIDDRFIANLEKEVALLNELNPNIRYQLNTHYDATITITSSFRLNGKFEVDAKSKLDNIAKHAYEATLDYIGTLDSPNAVNLKQCQVIGYAIARRIVAQHEVLDYLNDAVGIIADRQYEVLRNQVEPSKIKIADVLSLSAWRFLVNDAFEFAAMNSQQQQFDLARKFNLGYVASNTDKIISTLPITLAIKVIPTDLW